MGDPGRLKQARSQVGDELIAGSAVWNDRGGRGGPSVMWETCWWRGSEGPASRYGTQHLGEAPWRDLELLASWGPRDLLGRVRLGGRLA